MLAQLPKLRRGAMTSTPMRLAVAAPAARPALSTSPAAPPLEFDAVVFRHGPNRNHVRFRTEDLAAFAASFAGLPFLRNHAVEDVGARDGTVVASALVGDAFHQHIRLTTDRGVRDFQAGILDRFSIGWFYAGVECSICGRDWFGCGHWPGRRYPTGHQDKGDETGQHCELIFVEPVGKETSAVNAPAVPGTHVVEQLCMLKETQMSHVIYLPNGGVHAVSPTATLGQAAVNPAPDEVAAQVEALQTALLDQREALLTASGLSAAGQEMVRLALAHIDSGRDATYAAQLIEQQRRVEATAARRAANPAPRGVQGIRPITAGDMSTPEDRMQAALNWLLGARYEPVPPPALRSLREVYHAITGDYNWYGVFNPEWSQLSAASTTTLAGMVVNALNKVVRQHYDNLATYRWYEPLVEVVPHDGSTHAVQLIMVDGLNNLPSVGEGAAYTEVLVGDSKESFAFTKRGHYVGITLEAIRRGNLQRIQAIPRELVKSAIRARSAAIAGLFTANSGVGPTLADDSTALFHANHANLDTTAFSAAAWGAARQRIWNQTVPGTSSPLGLWPTFCLVPIELYDGALEVFGYGSGDVGKPNSGGTAQSPNPYGLSRVGDPRPVPVAVPDWTDATDWAYLVDPRLHPVIHMAYANAPQGGDHPLPEIFEATGETNGLMFTNDTLPVKIRDWWGYGVSSYVGVGKNNVAGS
jgi:hypothetical protein